MEIVVAVLLMVFSIFLIVKGGDLFVSSSCYLSKKMHIPQIVFGATFVSLATTLGELFISIFSSVNNSTELAVGNAVGSFLCNIGLICGIGFIFASTTVEGNGKLKYYLLMFATLFVTILGFFLEIKTWQAIIMICITVVFFVFNYLDAKIFDKSKTPNIYENQKPLWLIIILFLIGAICVSGGAYLLVDKVEFLAQKMGISQQLVGLTVVAIGTSLPELATMFTSIKKKAIELAIGNIIGANILNITLILGISKLISYNSQMPITKETAYVSLPLALIYSIIVSMCLLIKKKTYRWIGVVLLATYAMYILFLILNSIYKFL